MLLTRAMTAYSRQMDRLTANLLKELAAPAYSGREDAYALALTLQRAGWAWGALVVRALELGGVRLRQHRGAGRDADALRRTGSNGPCGGARKRWRGRHGCSCGYGSRACVHDGGYSAGKSA